MYPRPVRALVSQYPISPLGTFQFTAKTLIRPMRLSPVGSQMVHANSAPSSKLRAAAARFSLACSSVCGDCAQGIHGDSSGSEAVTASACAAASSTLTARRRSRSVRISRGRCLTAASLMRRRVSRLHEPRRDDS